MANTHRVFIKANRMDIAVATLFLNRPTAPFVPAAVTI